jgi:hypothetical protein
LIPGLILAREKHRAPGGFIVRLRVQNLAKHGERPVDVSDEPKIAGAPDLMLGNLRLELGGVAVAFERFAEMPVVGEDVPQIDPRRDISRVNRQTFPVTIQGLSILTELLVDDTGIVEVYRMVRLHLQRSLDPDQTRSGLPALMEEETGQMQRIPVPGVFSKNLLVDREGRLQLPRLTHGQGFGESFVD